MKARIRYVTDEYIEFKEIDTLHDLLTLKDEVCHNLIIEDKVDWIDEKDAKTMIKLAAKNELPQLTINY